MLRVREAARRDHRLPGFRDTVRVRVSVRVTLLPKPEP